MNRILKHIAKIEQNEIENIQIYVFDHIIAFLGKEFDFSSFIEECFTKHNIPMDVNHCKQLYDALSNNNFNELHQYLHNDLQSLLSKLVLNQLNNYVQDNNISLSASERDGMMNDMVDMLMTAAINVAIKSLPDVIDDVRELFKLNDSLNNDFDDSIYDKADEQDNIKIFENIMKKIIIDMNVVNKFADKLIRAGCPTKYEAYRIIADDKYFIQCTELIQSVINNSSIDTFGINIPKLIKEENNKYFKTHKLISIKTLQQSYDMLLFMAKMYIYDKLKILVDKAYKNTSVKVLPFKRK